MRKLLLITLILFLAVPVFSQWESLINPNFIKALKAKADAVNITKQAEAEKIRVWQLPPYMTEVLIYMQKDFSRQFEAKIEYFKKELKARFIEFKDLPDDVVLDPNFKVFVKRSDYIKIQNQARKNQEKRK